MFKVSIYDQIYKNYGYFVFYTITARTCSINMIETLFTLYTRSKIVYKVHHKFKAVHNSKIIMEHYYYLFLSIY